LSAPDVIVVGGGAVGCATALELTRLGATVTVIERDSVGSHASGSSYGGLFPTMGVGVPGPGLEPARWAAERHVSLAPELLELTEIDVQLRATATVTLAEDTEDLKRFEADRDWQVSEGFDTEVLSPEDVARLEPLVTRDIAGALIERSHRELDSYRYALALASAVEAVGGVVRHGSVVGLDKSHGRVTGVRLETGDRVAAGAVVLATGPWAGSDEGSDLPRLPVRPVKGEILRLEFPGGGFDRRVLLDDFYVKRKPDGQVWVGTTEEEAGFDDHPSERGRDAIMAGVLRIAPAVEDAALAEHTACLRPVSEDGLPVVGPLDGLDGLFVSTGAGKKGVLLSPALAAMLAPAVLGEVGEVPIPAEFLPSRFGQSASDQAALK